MIKYQLRIEISVDLYCDTSTYIDGLLHTNIKFNFDTEKEAMDFYNKIDLDRYSSTRIEKVYLCRFDDKSDRNSTEYLKCLQTNYKEID